MNTSRTARGLALSGLAALALCLAAAPAGAQRYDHRDGGHDRGRHEERRDFDRRDEHHRPPPPVYYRERPVYAPPPVYYGAPRGPSLNLFLPFGG